MLNEFKELKAATNTKKDMKESDLMSARPMKASLYPSVDR